MENRYKINIAIFMILLIIALPFYTSNVFAQQYSTNTSRDNSLPDASQACIDKFTETNDMIDFLESDTITTMQSIADLLLGLCTIANGIESILKMLEATIGDKVCCNLPIIGSALCNKLDFLNKAWDKIYFPFFRKICCLVSCGWCSGSGGCGGIYSGYDRFVNEPITTLDMSSIGKSENERVTLNKIFNIDAYQNIYFAVICLCPVAILYKLKELKLIYKTHACCIEQACKSGQSTEACDRALDTAICMYTEGALWQYLGGQLKGIFLAAAILLLKTLVFDTVLKHLTDKLSIFQCILKYWELKNLPVLIEQIIEAWKYALHSFNEPDCGELESAFEPIPYRGRSPTLPSRSDYEPVPRKKGQNYQLYEHRNQDRPEFKGQWIKVYDNGDWEWTDGGKEYRYDSSEFRITPDRGPSEPHIDKWGEAITAVMVIFLRKYLGEMADNYINEFVEEQCLSGWDQSSPPSNTPSNLNAGYGQSFISTTNKNLTGIVCINSTLTTVTAQATKTKLDSGLSYSISYSIAACKEPISYSVYLFESNLAYQNLDSGKLELDKLTSNTGTLVAGLDCDNICVQVSDNSVNIVCFPVVTTS